MVRAVKCWGTSGGAGVEGKHTSKKSIELDEEFEVDVVALRRFAMAAAHVVSVEIDTWRMTIVSCVDPL